MRDRVHGMPARLMRAEIDEALAHGVGLREVEHEIIDRAPVSDDARAALWLYAWGAAERRHRLPTLGRRPVATTWGRDGCGD